MQRDLGGNGAEVFPERIPINFPYLPDELSLRMYGKRKTRSDIDVVAKKGRFVFVLECKEQRHESRASIHNKNLLAKASTEIYYKANLLADPKRVKMLNKEGLLRFLSGNEDQEFIPLVITNNPASFQEEMLHVCNITCPELVDLITGIEELSFADRESNRTVDLSKVGLSRLNVVLRQK